MNNRGALQEREREREKERDGEGGRESTPRHKVSRSRSFLSIYLHRCTVNLRRGHFCLPLSPPSPSLSHLRLPTHVCFVPYLEAAHWLGTDVE